MKHTEISSKAADQKDLSRKSIRKIGEKPEKKKVRTASLPEILTAQYGDNLNNLVAIQNVLEKSFTEHPIYQEYHRKNRIKKQYKLLLAQYKKANAEVTAFHNQLRREHKKWIQQTKRAEKKVNIAVLFAERLGMVMGSILTRAKKFFFSSK